MHCLRESHFKDEASINRSVLDIGVRLRSFLVRVVAIKPRFLSTHSTYVCVYLPKLTGQLSRSVQRYNDNSTEPNLRQFLITTTRQVGMLEFGKLNQPMTAEDISENLRMRFANKRRNRYTNGMLAKQFPLGFSYKLLTQTIIIST